MMNHQLIDEQAVASARRFLHSEADLLVNIQRVDEARVWETLAYTSLFDYCTRRLKLSESNTCALISVARKAKSVPELKAAVVSGTLNISQAKRVVSVIDASNAKQWVEKASTLKQRELEREVAAVLPSPAPRERLKAVGGDMSELLLVIPQEMRKDIERLVEVRGCSMLEAVGFALKETLKRHDPLQKAQRNIGKPAVVHSSRNVPRRAPIPAQVTHSVVARDEARCTFRHPDGSRCENRRWLHAHHRTPVAVGGSNTIENLALLCSPHHRLLHRRLLAPAIQGFRDR